MTTDYVGYDGKHYLGTPPAGWWQASDDRWYPPQDPLPHHELEPERRGSAGPALIVIGTVVVVAVGVFAVIARISTGDERTTRGTTVNTGAGTLSDEDAALAGAVFGSPSLRAAVEDGRDRGEMLDLIRPLSDSLCSLAQDADDDEAFGTLLGLSYAMEESVQELFPSTDGYAVFATGALRWRCPSDATRLRLAG